MLLPACYTLDPRSYQTFSPSFGKTGGGVLQTLKPFRGSSPSPQIIRGTQVPAKVSAQGQRAGLCFLAGIAM